jgi:hypothetical protein
MYAKSTMFDRRKLAQKLNFLFELFLVRRLRLRAFQRLDDAGASNLGQPSGVRLLLADGQVQEVPHQVPSSGH